MTLYRPLRTRTVYPFLISLLFLLPLLMIIRFVASLIDGHPDASRTQLVRIERSGREVRSGLFELR